MPYARLDDVQLPSDQIGLALSEGAWDAHVAIAFRSVDDHELKFLHFFKNKSVRCDSRRQLVGRRWIGCIAGLSPLACKPLVGIVRVIAKNQPPIKLGINLKATPGSFTEGVYAPPPGSDGLTCTSFVAEIFRDAGYKLVDLASWPANFDNLQWGDQVHKALCKQGAPADQLDAVLANNTGLRLHPFEVGAVGEMPSNQWPVDYARASHAAAQLTALWHTIAPEILSIPKVIRKLLRLH